MAAAPILGDLIAADGTPAWARLAGNTTTTRKFLRQTGNGSVSALPAWDTLLAGDLPTHTHAESDVTNLATDLTNRPVKGGAWANSKTAVINSSGQLDGAAGTATDCVLVNGTSAAKANAVHTHAESDVTNLTTDLAGKAASVHTHAESDVTGLVTDLAAKAAKAGDTFTGTLRVGGDQAYLECGAFQTVGGAFENMAKYSEDFSVGTWDKNGGSCSVTANAIAAPDGNTTADTITASTATPIIQQNIAGLVAGGQYTFYVWAKVASGTKTGVDRHRGQRLCRLPRGPDEHHAHDRVAAVQDHRHDGRRADRRSGSSCASSPATATTGPAAPSTCGARASSRATIRRRGTRARGGTRPRSSRPESRAARLVVSAKDNAESPLRVCGPGSNLADHTLLEVTAGGELIIAGGTGNGYRLAELMGATNPSGWSGVLKVKNPAGVTAGYILLYSNP